MNDFTRPRSEILEFLRRELLGPDTRPEHMELNGGEEILRPQDPPRLRYSCGVLFPSRLRVEQADGIDPSDIESIEIEELEGDEPEDVTPKGSRGDSDVATEQEVNRANEYLPSAMGLTALIRMPSQLRVSVRAGRYEKKIQDGVGKLSKDGKWQAHYWRRPVIPDSLLIDCGPLTVSGPVTMEFPLEIGNSEVKLSIHIFSRPYAGALNLSNDRIVTVTLINRTPMTGDKPKDSECFFQCEFSVEGSLGEPCFLEYPEHAGPKNDDDEQSYRLLYRDRKTFAIGHGCAATWREGEIFAVSLIRTDCLPTHEIKATVPREIPSLDLSMRALARNDRSIVLDICESLAKAYQSWIEGEAERLLDDKFPSVLRNVADKHIEQCRQCHSRIVDGISVLKHDSDSLVAFNLMNRSMLMQQLHYLLASKHRRTWVDQNGALTPALPYVAPDYDNPSKGKGHWRPFQLAFILMNLRSMAARECAERSIVDLIWFPTGGGKTEAYLGLAAFTIFRRRLRDPDDAGTTVLMRYTLRLLTTQQFQRAASLVCACEMIRQERGEVLGKAPISIGLFVGGDVTPNKQSSSDRARPGAIQSLDDLLKYGKPNPFVVITCPWCGVEMGPVKVGNYYRAQGYRLQGRKVVFRCSDSSCDFSGLRGLPLHVVDEDIYDVQPTLVIGTVDKFAMMPWYPESRRLFGLSDERIVSPPDLIIQDELHLIAGALGSMVGIYETSIDALCQHSSGEKSYSAKIVASTATICRAAQQVHSLYARSVFIFPPQGLRAGDSFFAREATHDNEGKPIAGRLYTGVFCSALSSHVTAQIRVMAALLQAAKCIQVTSQEEIDPYWTLMAYFNSLRELGHAATLIRADIREYLNAMWDRLGIRKPELGSADPDRRRFINRDLELTSRIQSSQVTEVLQQLFNSYPGTREQRPVDVCLATNMIQVGLDVPRLGLMTVVGQPKTTSEYIQATSRVGRDERGPGLVAVVYNPAKPRDRSHFEHFKSYHQSIYRWVEPTSLTPFAVPVRERALHAQIVTLVRFWGDRLLRETSNPPPDDQLIDRLLDTIYRRVELVDPAEREMTVTMALDFINRWRRTLPPIYGQFGPPPDQTPLMYPSGTEPRALWSNRSKATPSSMRNVDAGCDAEVISQFPKIGES